MERDLVVKTVRNETIALEDAIILNHPHRNKATIKMDHAYAYKDDPKLTKDCLTGEYFLPDLLLVGSPNVMYIGKDKPLGQTLVSGGLIRGGNKQLHEYIDIFNDCVVICTLESGTTLYTLKSIMLEEKFVFEPESGIYYPPNTKISKSYHKESSVYLKFSNSFPNSRTKLDRFLAIKYGIASPTNILTEGLKYTFGVELETSSGRLHPSEYHNLNVSCVYDGSLKNSKGEAVGGEYVTGVLTGDAGFNQLNQICKKLSEKCTINNKCGVHVHIGITPTKNFIVSLFVLLQKLEDEVFRMVPKSRRNGPHSKTLPFIASIEKALKTDLSKEINSEFYTNAIYDELYKIILHRSNNRENPDTISNGKFRKHPMGDKCGFHRDTPRYCWVNFVPALFVRDSFQGSLSDYKDFTIEFRPHSASLNFKKIRNWVKICMAIVKYAENVHMSRILTTTITLSDVINFAYPKTGTALIEYIELRKETFRDDGLEVEEENPSTNFINSMSIKSLTV